MAVLVFPAEELPYAIPHAQSVNPLVDGVSLVPGILRDHLCCAACWGQDDGLHAYLFQRTDQRAHQTGFARARIPLQDEQEVLALLVDERGQSLHRFLLAQRGLEAEVLL